MDPRKPVHTPDNTSQDFIRHKVHEYLLEVTRVGSADIGCNGISFVLMGINSWLTELSELDQKATSELLLALSKLYDPKANDKQMEHAEKKRAHAVRRLFAAVDLDMAPLKGSA